MAKPKIRYGSKADIHASRVIRFVFRPASSSTPSTTSLMHERSAGGQADLIPILREDILAAIGNYIPVDSDQVQIRIERVTRFLSSRSILR